MDASDVVDRTWKSKEGLDRLLGMAVPAALATSARPLDDDLVVVVAPIPLLPGGDALQVHSKVLWMPRLSTSVPGLPILLDIANVGHGRAIGIVARTARVLAAAANDRRRRAWAEDEATVARREDWKSQTIYALIAP